MPHTGSLPNCHNPRVYGSAFRDGSEWQSIAGYSRARRMNKHIAVSGTTADLASLTTSEQGSTRAQVRDCLTRAIAAVEELGGSRHHIIRSRMFLAPDADPLEASQVHAELLGDVAPANTTLFVHALIGPGLLVEIELDAYLDSFEGLNA